MLVMVLGLPLDVRGMGEEEKVKGNQNLSQWATGGEFTDRIKFDKDDPTLFIDGDVGNIELSGKIYEKDSAIGIINKSGTATTQLSSSENDYQGDINITAGTIELIGDGVLRSGTYSGAIFVDSNGTMSFNTSADQTMSGALTGTGNLLKASSGTLTLTSNNAFTGTTTVNGGTIAIIGSGGLGSGNFSGDIDLGSGANTGIFKQNSTADQTLSGVISGSGALVKDNTGTLTLTGNNTYSGGTTLTCRCGHPCHYRCHFGRHGSHRPDRCELDPTLRHHRNVYQ